MMFQDHYLMCAGRHFIKMSCNWSCKKLLAGTQELWRSRVLFLIGYPNLMDELDCEEYGGGVAEYHWA